MHTEDLTRAAAALAPHLDLGIDGANGGHGLAVATRAITALIAAGVDFTAYAYNAPGTPEAILERRVEDGETFDDGTLRCPNPDCDGPIYEYDSAIRLNQIGEVEWTESVEPGTDHAYASVSEADSDFETQGWTCFTCGRIVKLHDDLEVTWS